MYMYFKYKNACWKTDIKIAYSIGSEGFIDLYVIELVNYCCEVIYNQYNKGIFEI